MFSFHAHLKEISVLDQNQLAIVQSRVIDYKRRSFSIKRIVRVVKSSESEVLTTNADISL